MAGKRVAVIHYMPLEIYPPVMNLVRTWDKMDTGIRMDVYTTGLYQPAQAFHPFSGITHIKRYGVSGKKQGLPARLFHYLHYYFFTLYKLIVTRPAGVLYFDTISSFPAIIYKMLFAKSRLFIHYNEYMSANEYRQGMFLVYHRTTWVSHTNQERMDLFLTDLPGTRVPHQYILPNFPPGSWRVNKQKDIEWPLKCVYTGALSMDTMYTRLFAEWVLKQQGKVTWDIYSLNTTEEAGNYIGSLPGTVIRLHEAVDYYELPAVLKLYDVGIILYNGHIPNYIFNAPNKLFEYAAAGLDVWFPHHLQSSWQYITKTTFPKIVSLDFHLLDEIDTDALTNRDGLAFQPPPFSCETVLFPLLEKLTL